jgi:UDP-2,3-diacylglucosamine hydrolase
MAGASDSADGHAGAKPSTGRLAIIAGGGFLPVHLARAARAAGDEPFIVTLAHEYAGGLDDFDRIQIGIGDFARLDRALKAHGVGRVVMSGGVRRRPDWRAIRPTMKTVAGLPRILSTLVRGGDDAVLRMVIGLIESNGYSVLGAQDIAADLLADEGALTMRRPCSADRGDIAAARVAALALGHLDIGQAAVAVGGRVVALEGPEGTDEMLARVAKLRRDGRITQRRAGVLVKFCKPQQDVRADLPSVGPSTVAGCAAAGLSGMVLEAGRSLVLERAKTVADADAAGLFIVGMTAETMS